jgi:hypothetical protein
MNTNIIGISRESINVEGALMKSGGDPTLCSVFVALITSTCSICFFPRLPPPPPPPPPVTGIGYINPVPR